MTETIMSVAIITALFTGAAALIKAMFTKNNNKEMEYQHTERMIELLGKQNDSSERLIQAVNDLSAQVGEIKAEVGNVVSRVDELEKKINRN